MKFLIKDISSSRKEIRLTINSVNIQGTFGYIIGETGGMFDEGTMASKYIPKESSKYTSVGPNPGIIRLVVAYLKDTLGTPIGSQNSILVTKDNEHIPIVNIAIDDVTLFNLTSETIPSVVIKLLKPLGPNIHSREEVTIEQQLIVTQDQEVYYISAEEPPDVIRGLDYDMEMRDEIGNSDAPNLDYENYNQLTSSFNHGDDTIIHQIISGSDLNLKVDYSNFSNHVHFGSAVVKLENFKRKVTDIETSLIIISKSLETASLQTSNDVRKVHFNKIQTIKDDFTPYEKSLYYKSDTLGYRNNLNLGPNYIKASPLKNSTPLQNYEGFKMVYQCSASKNSGSGHVEMFKDQYFVEDKPFYNYSGSFYLSYLMRGDEGINGSIVWKNNQENHYPRLPHDSLYTSSILTPNVKSGSWNRYIYQASMSYWAPKPSADGESGVVGTSGAITEFGPESSEIMIFSGSGVTGSFPITLGSRYTNLATTITSSGIPFTGSIVPAGELFRLYIDTTAESVGNEITSSYLSDIKITKYNPSSSLPFSEIFSTGSAEFNNWYNEQYDSASAFDRDNVHNLIKTLPAFLGVDNEMDNTTFRKFCNMMGEQYDVVKNYVDAYPNLFKTQYGDVGSISENLLPMMAKNYNWHLMLPFGKKQDADLQYFLGSTISSINNNSNAKNNIWRNVVNNIHYIYKTKGTQRGIRALLNSYGFPPDVLKIKEHGSSLEQFNDSVLSNDSSNLIDGIGGTSGSLSFDTKEDDFISYNIDTTARQIGMEWWRDDAEPNAIEFVFNPDKSLNDQKLLISSGGLGSDQKHLWELVLEPSASAAGVVDNTKSRLSFILNNTSGSAGSLNTAGNFISMSTDYLDLKNRNNWNILLQRTSGPSSSFWDAELETTQSYELFVAEQKGDKIRTFEAVSMSYSGSSYKHAGAAWLSTGSRATATGQNLVVGMNYTGSIAEIRTWKQALSASVFKQHIFDKKSVVGNNYSASKDELIYHFRLNEDWRSGSLNQKFKDYNPNNIKNYTIDYNALQQGSFNSSSMYDINTVDRIQFNVKIGGAYEANENNIIINPDVRFVDNLNPINSSILDVYDPLINKRKASSELELTRTPQNVINDFILNQIGNYDFNDLFADPQDINEESYKDLEKFAKDFFDHYDISIDVNKYIKAQAAIFNKDLINSLKRLVPARAKFEKVGVELKPTFFDRQKIQNEKIEKEYVNFQGDISFTDWDKDKYSTFTINNLESHDNKYLTNIPISSHTGSIVKNFTSFEPLYDYKQMHIEVYSPTGSKDVKLDEDWKVYENKEGQIAVASATGSYPETSGKFSVPLGSLTRDKKNEAVITISSETGSIVANFSSLEPLHTTHDITFKVADSSGSIAWDFKNVRNYLYYESDIALSSATGSQAKNFVLNEPYDNKKEVTIVVSSATGSQAKNFTTNEPLYKTLDNTIDISSDSSGSIYAFSDNINMYKTYDSDIPLATSTGSIVKDFSTYEPLYTTKDAFIEVASPTGSSQGYYDFTNQYKLWKTHDAVIELASATGSSQGYYDFTTQHEIYETKDGIIPLATATGSMAKDFTKLEPLQTTYDTDFSVANSTGSIAYDFNKLELNHQYHNGDIPIASETGSVWDFEKLEPLYKTKDGDLPIASHSGSLLNLTEHIVSTHDSTIVIASETGSKVDLTKLEPLYKTHDAPVDIGVNHKYGPNSTSSISFDSENDLGHKLNIGVSSATGSNPTITNHVIETKDGTFNFSGDTTFYEHLNKSYSDIGDQWGTGSSDIWFINSAYSGSIGLFNTYHYEKRYIFHHFGDVESVSGSVPSLTGSFETDFYGTFGPASTPAIQDPYNTAHDNRKYTSSIHFKNQTFVSMNEFLGLRPLGTTIEIKYSGSLDGKGYKFIDEHFVYPANHIHIVGTTRDSIDRLIYKGTQNGGGDPIESLAFTDLSEDAFYRVLTPGNNAPTVNS